MKGLVWDEQLLARVRLMGEEHLQEDAEAMLPQELRALFGMMLDEVPDGVRVTFEIDNTKTHQEATVDAVLKKPGGYLGFGERTLELRGHVYQNGIHVTVAQPTVTRPARREDT